MNLFSGLEKFGIDTEEMDLFGEKKEPKQSDTEGQQASAEETHSESEFLLEKGIRCPVCDSVFKTLMVKNGRVKRLEPDKDLRPRHQYIDTLKYNIQSCPKCGYTALSNMFEHITSIQTKLVKEKVCGSFDPSSIKSSVESGVGEWDYDTAVSLHKLSLLNCVVKKGKTSETAYNCLILAWLIRGEAESLSQDSEENKKKYAELKGNEEAFYKQAYDGFTMAVSTEMFPMCGMDQTTVEYLLATMAYHYGQLEIASKCLANILTSQTASRKVKDKALDLKDEIIAEIRSRKK